MQSSRSRRIACHTLSCALAIVYSMTHAASAADSQSLQGELAILFTQATAWRAVLIFIEDAG